ncbi:MAG: hypothetical protein ACOC40_01280 [Thermoplasmatota archaeon]
MKDSNILAEIPELKWNKQCTFIGALESALNYLDEDTDYVELMGMSGAAFRIQFNSVEWSTTCVDMYSRSESAAFLGYYLEKYRILNRDGTVSTPKENLFKIIKEEIDSGRPVIGLNMLNTPDWGLIAGYDGSDLLVRDYHEKYGMKKKEGYVAAHRFPNIIFILKKDNSKPDKVEHIKKSLDFSVNRFKLNKMFDKYLNGFSAYNAWINGLSDENRFSKMDEKMYRNHWLVNGLMYSNLYDARHCAHLFLKRVSKIIPADRLKEAAEYYSDLDKVIWDNWIYFPLPFFVKKGEKKISIPGGRYVEGDDWTPEMRKYGYKSLRLIKKMEYRALKKLEMAVDKWDESNQEFLNMKADEVSKDIV